MTNEDEQYYENFFDLFALEGWKQYVKDAETSKENFIIENIDNEKTLFHTRGQLDVINNIINLETKIRYQFDQLKAEEMEEVDVDDE